MAVAGLLHRDPQISLIRGALSVGTLVLVTEQADGAASLDFVAWLVILSALLPFSLSRRHARVAPLVIAGVYIAVASLGLAQVAPADAVMNSLVFLTIGLVAFITAHIVFGLREERDSVAGRLARAEGTLQTAFSATQVAMAVLELDGTVRRLNPAMCDLMGGAEADLMGAAWLDAVHEDHRADLESRMQDLAAGLAKDLREECRFGDGSDEAWGVVEMSIIHEGSGPLHLFVNVVDISERVRSEARLRRSENHHRTLFDLSPVPMWLFDMTMVVDLLTAHAGLAQDPDVDEAVLGAVMVKSVNEAGRNLIGLEDTPVTGAAPSLDDAAGGRSAFAGLIRGIRSGQRRMEWAAALVDRDGLEHVGTVRAFVPEVDGRADLGGVLVAFADATEKQRTEHALRRIEQRLRTVMSGAPILLFAVDESGVLTLSEGQVLAALGEAPGGAIGRSVFELRRDSMSVIRNVRRALTGETFTATDEIGTLVLETRYSPVWEGGKPVGVIGVSYDVTDRVHATEQLRELVRSKDEFVATVSHELRTPLTAVVGFAHELRAGLSEMEDEDIAAFVDLIDEQATEVGDLVEDLLVASRFDRGAVPVDLTAVDLWEQVEAVCRGRRIGKVVDIERVPAEVKVFADPIRVRQIVRNLLTNADRYGGQRIVVKARSTGDATVLDVVDDGPGVPASHRAFIFEPYQRAHQIPGRTDSVGLGLTVSRQLARLMGGDLVYERTPEWSVFSLTLPAA